MRDDKRVYQVNRLRAARVAWSTQVGSLLMAATLLLIRPACTYGETSAQPASVLKDVNGDGMVQISAFGDSITYGVGDGTQPGEVVEVITESGVARGYPKRLATLLNILVRNAGIPGEELVAQGVYRIPQVVGNAELDTIVIMEGSNDSVLQIARGEYTRSLQTAINVARAAGKEVVVATLPPPTGVHESLAPITESYSTVVRDLALINNIALADVEALWYSACADMRACDLYNQPEGLHPNTKGYTALAQIFAAALLGIDLLSPDGRAALAGALGVPVSSVVVGVESSAPATPTATPSSAGPSS